MLPTVTSVRSIFPRTGRCTFWAGSPWAIASTAQGPLFPKRYEGAALHAASGAVRSYGRKAALFSGKRLRMGRRILLRLCIPDPPADGAAGPAVRAAPGRSLDACAPCVAVMIAFMRFGCFLNGCCGGWEMVLGISAFSGPRRRWRASEISAFLLCCCGWKNVMTIRVCAMPFSWLHTVSCVSSWNFSATRRRNGSVLDTDSGFAVISCLIGGALLLRERKAEKSSI